MLIEQISVFIENKQGRLAEVMQVLNNSGVDIRAINIADTTDFGIMRIIADDTQKAINALKSDGFTAAVTKVIAFTISDVSGSLYNVMDIFNDNGINIDYLYSVMGKTSGRADIVVHVKDTDNAIKVLTKNGVQLISSAELRRD